MYIFAMNTLGLDPDSPKSLDPTFLGTDGGYQCALRFLKSLYNIEAYLPISNKFVMNLFLNTTKFYNNLRFVL